MIKKACQYWLLDLHPEQEEYFVQDFLYLFEFQKCQNLMDRIQYLGCVRLKEGWLKRL